MGSNRITQLHVYIIGVVLLLIVGGGLYFALLRPVYTQLKNKKADLSSLEASAVSFDDGKNKTQITYTLETGPQSVKKAQAVVQQAKANSAYTLKQLAILEAGKQLPASKRIDLGDGTDPYLLSRTLPNWLNLPRNVVPLMRDFAVQLGHKHGVTVLTDFAAPAPQPDPKAIPHDIIAWNLGKIQATGNFNSVMQWARDWTSAPLLTALDGLQCSLAGPSGNVVADGTLTVYIFPTGKTGIVQIPASPSAGSPGGGFGGGNGPGGMSAMPGGFGNSAGGAAGNGVK
jgi:hypothetical protein